MNIATIKLTPTQRVVADWLIGTPLIEETGGASLAEIEHDRDIGTAEACELKEAVALVKLEAETLTVPMHCDTLDYLIGDCERYAEIEQDDGIDDRLNRGMTHRQAALDAAAKARSALALAEKLRLLKISNRNPEAPTQNRTE